MYASFSGKRAFLSNFYPIEILIDNKVYPSTEHAYQAMKTLSETERETIRLAESCRKAKRLGRKVTLREDFNKIKLDIMRDILIFKFSNKELQDMLVATGEEELVEVNYWNDTYWGVCNGKGENNLGKLLMEIRSFINNLRKLRSIS